MSNNQKTIIATDAAPKAIGPYSQAVKIGSTVYISGQIPLVPTTMELISDDIALQIKQVFENIAAIAKAAGGSLENIVKLTVYLTDLTHWPKFNEIMLHYFKEPFPARAVIAVSALPKNSQVEIESIMVV